MLQSPPNKPATRRFFLPPDPRPMMPSYDTLIRADFLVAVGLLVVAPLILLVVSLPHPEVRDRLLAYWRASALLGITVYLWIDEAALGFATGYAARAFIPVALWWGDALTTHLGRSHPVGDRWPASLFRGWRLAATVYSAAGLVYMLPLLPCAWVDASSLCQAWYLPPQEYARLAHPYTAWSEVGTYGRAGLAVYVGYAAATAYVLWRESSNV